MKCDCGKIAAYECDVCGHPTCGDHSCESHPDAPATRMDEDDIEVEE